LAPLRPIDRTRLGSQQRADSLDFVLSHWLLLRASGPTVSGGRDRVKLDKQVGSSSAELSAFVVAAILSFCASVLASF
jgi:hypothetical protein